MSSIPLRRALAACLLALAPLSPVWAQDGFESAYATLLDGLRASCAAIDNGAFDAPDGAVSRTTDFNGDGVTDPVVREYEMGCSTSATLFSGGTGGGALHVFVSRPEGGFDRFAFLALNAAVIMPQGQTDRPVLLLAVHPSQCDVVAEPCMAAYAWSDIGRFVSPAGVVEASR